MVIKKILLATDFSPPAQQLVECISEFKSWGLEEVVLLHVIDVRSPGGSSISLQAQDQTMLERNKSQLEAMGFRVKSIFQIGFPAQEIVYTAQQEKVSLIAITSHGGGFIKQIFLGSTTTDVIRLSDIPVLVEKFKDMDMEACKPVCQNKFKKILVPLDFSVYTYKLLAQVKAAAPLLNEVILFSAVERAGNEKEWLKLRSEKEQRLEEAGKELQYLGLKIKVRVAQGSASRNIVEIAEQEDVGLIFMGTRGEGIIKNLLLGSTAHAVARRSKRSLLLMPPR
jgi:nucleotide-binding universal stress UspA family protein